MIARGPRRRRPVRDRCDRREVGPLAGETVVRAERVRDEALAARHAVVETQQPDEVGPVAVEQQRRRVPRAGEMPRLARGVATLPPKKRVSQ